MKEKPRVMEELTEKIMDYSKTSFELVKLKTVEKTTDVLSSLIPHSIVLIVISFFWLFVNLGLAFWLGEFFGELYYGLWIIAGFYLIISLMVHFIFHRSIKRKISNYFIKQFLK